MTALGGAVTATLQRPSLWVVALGGFLARGGIVLLVLPLIPLPSTVGMATFVGPTSVTAAGLTPDSVVRIALIVALTLGWLLAGSLVGALADIATVGQPGAGPRLVARLIAVRLVALLPLVAVVAITARSVGELVYQELVLPSDIAAPIVLRVVQGAQVQVAAIAAAWLVGEVLGGIAVRLAILERRSFVRAIGGAAIHVLRHPLTTLIETVAGLIVLSFAIGPALAVLGLAWAALSAAASGPLDGAAIVGATILLVGAWLATAALAAIIAAWRGAVWTIELSRGRPPA